MKGKLVVVAIVLALFYGGYSIFYGSSPVGDLAESLSSEDQQEASYALGSDLENEDVELSSSSENLERKTILLGRWQFDYQNKTVQFIDRIKGEVTYKDDGTFSKTGTYTHYGSNPNGYPDMYLSTPRMVNGHIIARGGVTYSGTWYAYDNTWSEVSNNCRNKITITKKNSSSPYYGSSPCSFFPEGEIKYGAVEAGFTKWELKEFSERRILFEFEDFDTGGSGFLLFEKK